ncbi:MAG: transcription-repair coupling factor [Bacteroidales bacterium]|jgi:transcription-repair coupling factor (superfamily II helicase)|nr:transcription-repair coupling factor [Bacteroidales bacterium]
MTSAELIQIYRQSPNVKTLVQALQKSDTLLKAGLSGFSGSSRALIAAATISETYLYHLFILQDREEAAYFHNDLEKLLDEYQLDFEQKNVLFFPASAKRPYDAELVDNANVLQRAEVLHRLSQCRSSLPALIIVTYPEALSEKVITQTVLRKNTIKLQTHEAVSLDFVIDLLIEHHFERVDFVLEPGQYAVRGGILDVFSFAGDDPYRLEFFGDEIESIRSFDAVSQLSKQRYENITILPNIHASTPLSDHNPDTERSRSARVSIFAHLPKDTAIWLDDAESCSVVLNRSLDKATQIYQSLESLVSRAKPEELYCSGDEFLKDIKAFPIVEFGMSNYFKHDEDIAFDFRPQPAFNKQFELLVNTLLDQSDNGYSNLILSDNAKQIQRLERVFFELGSAERQVRFIPLKISVHEGFIDHQQKIACFTDHQIFERYHRFTTHRQIQNKETITLKELYDLKPGDYVTHIDHGVARFGGLEKTEVGGHQQETIRLVYKDNDVLFISIHALHKISRYSGKEGTAPTLTRLGSNTWSVLKHKAKQRVKDIAKDLIKLYAQRKASRGFAFNADSFLQNELEASFFYEDTPDQLKATQDVKTDMESISPMDRLICGDVGFGKTEVAIRAAFKAVSDGKQVAVLVPTTILAFQHYKTFSERLKNMPCKVDYISRFRTTKEKTHILKELKNGQVDILIGTHRLTGKDIQFKDLGLLIIDEEQKFGVAMKEKLKAMKVNVDTLALSATPIPRTLQFSLMGARDMSIISTPPPNRFPVHTEIHVFDEEIIRDAIVHELSRGGQVFFVHSRVQNIMDIAGLVQRLVPDARIGVGHGQMDGDKLEDVMMSFIEGELDILVATKIVENGLDIPNANTIIINEAQAYGLSELHQLRGRVGRSNKKSFCYLISPPSYQLSDEAKKRLRAIEEFSEIGSGFNIAMRDLDIRGAGNVLGAEQSGFIADIGFDTYHKILDEAIQELKETEFKDLYQSDEKPEILASKDCVIETDLELLMPDTYVNSVAERLSLYKQLDALETDEELATFKHQLEDRFGKVPPQTEELIETIKMRRMAKQIGLEKAVLKRQKFVGTFITDQDSTFYQSPTFEKVLEFVKNHPKDCEFKEINGKLTIAFPNIKHVSEVCNIFEMF